MPKTLYAIQCWYRDDYKNGYLWADDAWRHKDPNNIGPVSSLKHAKLFTNKIDAEIHCKIYLGTRVRVIDIRDFVPPTKEIQVTALRDKTSEERKAEPIYTGCVMYFPDALAAVSRVSNKANAKHNGPDAPLHWSRGKSSDQMDAAVRHIMEPEVIDPDTGEIALSHAAWRILAQLQLAEEKRLIAAGIKPISGVTQ